MFSLPALYSRRIDALANVAIALWAFGAIVSEGISQAGYALAGLWLIVVRRKRPKVVSAGLLLSCLGLALWQAVSPVISYVSSEVSWPRSLRYSQSLNTLAVLVAAEVIGTVRIHAWIWRGFGLGWIASSCAAAVQHFGQWPSSFHLLSRTAHRIDETVEVAGELRHFAGGLIFHRLRFAHAAIASLGLFFTHIQIEKKQVVRWFWGAVVIAALAGMYFGFAKAGLITAMMVIFVGLLATRQNRWLPVAILVFATVALVASQFWRQRISDGLTNVVSGERERAWNASIGLIRENPLWGVGFGNHQPAALARNPSDLDPRLAIDGHNLWLTTWAETGLLGLLLLAAVNAFLVRDLWRLAKASDRYAQGALLSLLGFHVLSMVHYLPYHSGVHLTFALMWGYGLQRRAQAHPAV